MKTWILIGLITGAVGGTVLVVNDWNIDGEERYILHGPIEDCPVRDGLPDKWGNPTELDDDKTIRPCFSAYAPTYTTRSSPPQVTAAVPEINASGIKSVLALLFSLFLFFTMRRHSE